MLEAAKFDAALGVYLLTLALVLPLAGFSAKGRRRWVGWTCGLTVFSFAMENVQAWRGLNPRFSPVAGPVDQALGGVFFLAALGVATLYFVPFARFFRRETLTDHPALALALRSAAAAAVIAFAVGIGMSVAQGRHVNGLGNLMPIHASGFHGLQALPLVALLLGWSHLTRSEAIRWVHIAGIGWLAVCLGLLAQALLGFDPLTLTLPTIVVALGAFLWAATAACMRGAPAPRREGLLSQRGVERTSKAAGIDRGIAIEPRLDRREVFAQSLTIDKTAIEHFSEVLEISRVPALDFRERLRRQVEVAERQLTLLRYKRTALSPRVGHWDEVVGRGKLDVQVHRLLERWMLAARCPGSGTSLRSTSMVVYGHPMSPAVAPPAKNTWPGWSRPGRARA